MQKYLFTLWAAAVLIGCHQSTKKTRAISTSHHPTTKPIHYNDLTALDRKNYRLTVVVNSSDLDTCAGNLERYKITATLQNNANDTLKYPDMTCSHMIWQTNSDLVWADERKSYCLVCTANFFTFFEVPPHSTKQFELIAEFEKDVEPTWTSIRIGMIVQKALNFKDEMFYFAKFDQGDIGALSRQTQNIIWSNEITIH